MRIKLIAVSVFFLFSSAICQDTFAQKNTSIDVKNMEEKGITYIQASPATVAVATPAYFGLGQGKRSGIIEKSPLQGLSNPKLIDDLNGIISNFDKLFASYKDKSKNSEIQKIELGIAVNAEGNFYIVSGGSEATLKITIQKK